MITQALSGLTAAILLLSTPALAEPEKPLPQLPGETAWPGCTFYSETDSRLPKQVFQFLAKQRSIIPTGYAPAPSTVDVCSFDSKIIRLYFVETAPVMDVPGVCSFDRYQLDPADVGGRQFPGVKISNYYWQTRRTYMQLAKTCPPQRDKNYISASYVSGGLFGTLATYWRNAVRSPATFKKTFSRVRFSAPNPSVRTVTTFDELVSAVAKTPNRLRVGSIELDNSNLRTLGKSGYIIGVLYLRPSSNPVDYKFNVDILNGKITPISIVEFR